MTNAEEKKKEKRKGKIHIIPSNYHLIVNVPLNY
jgi:hypothetical protein